MALRDNYLCHPRRMFKNTAQHINKRLRRTKVQFI
jgi:hypothetical protein